MNQHLIRVMTKESYFDTNGNLNRGQNQDALKKLQLHLCLEQKNLLMFRLETLIGNYVKKYVLLPLSSVQKRIAYHLNQQCINIVETLHV